jgi:copper chaperone CopZ
MTETNLEKILLDLPAMYADHHVAEVRRILFSLPGMKEVYASSAFKVVEASYDPAQVSAEAIRKALDEAGYLGEMAFPTESGEAGRKETPTFFRHTDAIEAGQKSVSFGQNVNYMGRPLWPCPGMGVIKKMEE